jgi:structural maintenance of chromosome 1
LYDVSELSGGEKTIAALALIFASLEYQNASFLVFDEVDAFLDPENVEILSNYLEEQSKKRQCILISHKDALYSKSESLIGITSNSDLNSSECFSLDLR